MNTRQRRTRRFPARWLWALVLLLSAWAVTARAQGHAVSEAEIKAAFLVNFAKFTEWPVSRLPPTAPMEFCVVDAPVATALRTTVAGRLIGQHPLVVTQVKADDVLRGCAVLYVGRLDAKGTARIVAGLEGASVLSVGDLPSFIETGGIIRLYVDNGRMRFAVNVNAVDRARLLLSSQLLGVARIIKDGRE